MDSLRPRVSPQSPASVSLDVTVLDVPIVCPRHAGAAHVLLPGGAGLAVHAAVHHAAHPHPVPHLALGHALTNSCDHPCQLMTRHTRVLRRLNSQYLS